MKQRLIAALVAVVLVGAATTLLIWRPWHRPSMPSGSTLTVEGDIGALLDPARQVTIVWVNRTGRPCKATIDGEGASITGSWSVALPEGEAGGRFSSTGPFTLKAVTIERGEDKVRREVGLTLPSGTTHEVRIGPGDTVEVVAVGK